MVFRKRKAPNHRFDAFGDKLKQSKWFNLHQTMAKVETLKPSNSKFKDLLSSHLRHGTVTCLNHSTTSFHAIRMA